MATKGTIQIEGLRELSQRIAKLQRDVQLKIARSATNAGAQVIKRRAKDRITSNSSKNQTSIDTGSLLNAVVVKRLGKSESNLTSEHIVAVRRRKSGRKTKTLQATAPHAALVEFGTVHQPPEPFMRPAFDEGKEEALGKMIAKLEAGIDKAVG